MGGVSLAAFRDAETAFFETANEQHLDRMDATLNGDLAGCRFAAATRVWLLVLRHDRFGDDAPLDAAVEAVESLAARGDLSPTVPVLLRRWWRSGNAADLDRAIDDGNRTVWNTAPSPLWLAPAWRTADLVTVLLERYRFRGDGTDLTAGAKLMSRVHGRSAVPTLRALIWHTRARLDHELYLCQGRRALLERAITGYRRTLDILSPSGTLRPTVLTELGTALQDRYAEDGDDADLVQAISLAEEAARTERGRTELSAHLVNLGTALSTRHEDTGDPHDLDDALQAWQSALDALPLQSPYRAAFLDRLTLGHMTRWETEVGTAADLRFAIECGRQAVTHQGSPDLAVYLGNLSRALEYRWQVSHDPEALHEALRTLRSATSPDANLGVHRSDLLSNLAHLHLTRYEALGEPADVDAALAVLLQLGDMNPGPSRRVTVAASTARALKLRYLASGDPADLDAGLRAARASLRGIAPTAVTHAPRATQVAGLLYLRYLRNGRGGDLDAAVQIMRGVVRHQPTANHLGVLSTCLLQRYQRSGDRQDRDEAIRVSEDAAADDFASHLVAAVGDSRHERFATEGTLADLEEATLRQRDALSELHPHSPIRPILLNNLAIILQHRFDYYADETALAEAVELHELAVATCPPNSPDLPGLLDSLVAALRLRFDHRGDHSDLDRAVEHGRRALQLLSPHAPNRTSVQANLAAVLVARARSYPNPADTDEAITLFRKAVRRYPAHRPGRSIVLSGYAEALADRYAVSRERQKRRAVQRAFQAALDGSMDAPVERIDVAASLGRWAGRQQLWPVAAEAYRLAASARRTLALGQAGDEQRATWLTYGDELAVLEARARIQCSDFGEAAVAVEGGRALTLAERLEARTISARLRARGYGELATQYDRAAAYFARLMELEDIATRLGSAVPLLNQPSVAIGPVDR